MNIIVPLLLLATSLGLFFGYTKPTYDGMSSAIETRDQTLAAVEESSRLKDKIAGLAEDYNKISLEDVKKLDVMYPNSNDSVKTIIILQNLANKNHVAIADVNVEEPKNDGSFDASQNKNFAILKFKAKAPYSALVSFMGDVENNLRLIDTQALTVTSVDEKTNVYNVQLSVKIGWFDKSQTNI